MEMKKLLFIYNPKSGTGKIKSRLSDVIDMCVKEGYEVTYINVDENGIVKLDELK